MQWDLSRNTGDHRNSAMPSSVAVTPHGKKAAGAAAGGPGGGESGAAAGGGGMGGMGGVGGAAGGGGYSLGGRRGAELNYDQLRNSLFWWVMLTQAGASQAPRRHLKRALGLLQVLFLPFQTNSCSSTTVSFTASTLALSPSCHAGWSSTSAATSCAWG